MATTSPASAPSSSRGSSLEPHLASLTPKVAAALVREHLDPAGIREFSSSSPARLIAMAVALVVLCVTAGAVTASTVSDRQSTMYTVLDRTEPYAASAQRLFSSLSIADAAASTAFISGGLEPQSVRDRYTQAIGDAAAELAGGAAGTAPADAPERKLLTGIATELPVYTGLIETARADNRSGLPVGAAYLGEASTLMQTKTLPMAQQLQVQQAGAVQSAQQRFVHPPWLAMALLIFALAALVVSQIYLFRRWRRLFNPGLILASIALAAAFAWLVIAGSVSSAANDRALHHGTQPLQTLTQARILGQQARSDETLQFVRRTTSADYDQSFSTDMTKLQGLLAGYGPKTEGASRVQTAITAADGWRTAHQRMKDTLAAGDFAGASAVTVGAGSSDSMAQFRTLDGALTDGIAQARGTMRSGIAHAAGVLDTLSPAMLLLSIFAAIWVAVGIWPRLREYR